MILEESIKNSIKIAIKEELGVSNVVKDFTYKVLKNICNNITRNFRDNATVIKNGVKLYRFDISDILNYHDNKFKINFAVNYYNFVNNDIYEANKYDINCDFATSTTDGRRMNFINLYCYGIGGTINKTALQSTIQHEVEHIFQGINGNKQITSFDKVYAIASQNLLSDNKALMYISNLIYYSYVFEQDGYVNSLYVELINKDNPTPTWDDIKDTSMYVAISMIRKSLRILEKNREKKSVIDVLDNYFGINIDTLLKTGKTAEKRLLIKIGKILIKIRQDKQEQGVMFESTKPWITDYFID